MAAGELEVVGEAAVVGVREPADQELAGADDDLPALGVAVRDQELVRVHAPTYMAGFCGPLGPQGVVGGHPSTDAVAGVLEPAEGAAQRGFRPACPGARGVVGALAAGPCGTRGAGVGAGGVAEAGEDVADDLALGRPGLDFVVGGGQIGGGERVQRVGLGAPGPGLGELLVGVRAGGAEVVGERFEILGERGVGTDGQRLVAFELQRRGGLVAALLGAVARDGRGALAQRDDVDGQGPVEPVRPQVAVADGLVPAE